MPAVSDTSPILGLSAIGLLELLQEQFGAVFIPQAVLSELKVAENFRGTASVQKALDAGWLKPAEIQNHPLVQSFSLELDQGEAEAIALAIDLEIKMVVMDERIGRERVKSMGLKTVGVIGVLLKAKKQGRIASMKKAMDDLRREAGFFISKNLYQKILEEAEEAE